MITTTPHSTTLLNQSRFAVIACSLSLSILVLLTGLSLNVHLNPHPQEIQSRRDAAEIYFAADRTNFVFPGGCSQVVWKVEQISKVFLYQRGVTGEGSLNVCNGDAPFLRVGFQDQSERIYTLNRRVLFLQPPVIILALLGVGLGTLGISQFNLAPLVATRHREYLSVTLVAVTLVALLAVYTRAEYLVVKGTLDAARTAEIAHNGWVGNPNLIAPWAYRPLIPLLARLIADIFGQSVETGFAVVTFISMVSLLILCYALARHFGAGIRGGLVVLLTIWLSYYILRFSLADIYRPDSLAYVLMLIAVWLLFEERIGWCLLVCCTGILTREFLAIPAVMLALWLLIRLVQTRSRRYLLWVSLVVLAVSVVVILPRALIPVVGSEQMFDPQNHPDEILYALARPFQNTPRNVEFLVAAVTFLLPTILLATPGRIRLVWSGLAGKRWLLGGYLLLTLLLTMYGGSGIYRYITYLFVLQTIILAIWLPQISRLEILLMLVILALCNRLLWMPLIDPFTSELLWHEGLDTATYIPRINELLVYIGGAAVLRIGNHFLARRTPITPVSY